MRMQKVILVGGNLSSDPEFDRSMEELENLAKACELEVAARTAQNISAVNTAFISAAERWRKSAGWRKCWRRS